MHQSKLDMGRSKSKIKEVAVLNATMEDLSISQMTKRKRQNGAKRGGKIHRKYIRWWEKQQQKKKAGLPFKPKQLLTPFSSHSPPSMLHGPSPSLDDKGNPLQTEHEYNYDSENDANHPDEVDVHLG